MGINIHKTTQPSPKRRHCFYQILFHQFISPTHFLSQITIRFQHIIRVASTHTSTQIIRVVNTLLTTTQMLVVKFRLITDPHQAVVNTMDKIQGQMFFLVKMQMDNIKARTLNPVNFHHKTITTSTLLNTITSKTESMPKAGNSQPMLSSNQRTQIVNGQKKMNKNGRRLPKRLTLRTKFLV